MPFQIKSFLSIVASMVNRMRVTTTKVNDYTIGSIVRVLVEAPAQEIGELYQQTLAGIQAGIATGTYNTFGFPALAAAPATGPIRVYITAAAAGVLIPAGSTLTVTSGGAQTFASITDVTIPAGNTYGDIPVIGNIPGSAGGVPAAALFSLSPLPAGFQQATNLAALVGTDAETDVQRKLRFNQMIASLARSPTYAVETGARTATVLDAYGNVIEQAKLSQLVEPYQTNVTQPPGLMNIYVHNGVGSTSAALVASAQQIVDGYVDTNGNRVIGYKAAGTVAVVSAATEVPVGMTATLSTDGTVVHATAVISAQAAIYAYILGLGIGSLCPVVKAEITADVIALPGVTNFVFAAGSGTDVAISDGQKAMPGALAIT